MSEAADELLDGLRSENSNANVLDALFILKRKLLFSAQADGLDREKLQTLVGHFSFWNAADCGFSCFDHAQLHFDETISYSHGMTPEKADHALASIAASAFSTNRCHNLCDILIEGQGRRNCLAAFSTDTFQTIATAIHKNLAACHPLHRFLVREAVGNLCLSRSVYEPYDRYITDLKMHGEPSIAHSVSASTWWGRSYFGSVDRMIEAQTQVLLDPQYGGIRIHTSLILSGTTSQPPEEYWEIAGLRDLAESVSHGLRNCSPTGKAPSGPQALRAGQTASSKESKGRGKKLYLDNDDARTLIIGLLTEHHRLSREGALNTEALGNNQMARTLRISPATVSAFFKYEFGGYKGYQRACRDEQTLLAHLHRLNGTFPSKRHMSLRPGASDGKG